jgi:lipopolysaccharide export system protein LptC
MILTPLSPRGEVSFLLDRNKVAVTPERIHVDKAMYRGEDDEGRPFLLTAGSAIQPSPASPILELTDLIASIELKDGPRS